MRRLAVAMLVVAAAGAAAPAMAQTAPTAATQPAADTALPLQAWVDAFNSRDPKRIVALYAPDAVLWGTTAKTLARTPDEIWSYFRDAGQRPQIRVTVQQVHARSVAGLILVSGAYTFADVQGDVWTNERRARFSFVFRRDGDRWLIVEHHSSRVPEP
jgi:uncharacterized protein (TIGR02246 family)